MKAVRQTSSASRKPWWPPPQARFVHPLADVRKLELRVVELIIENFQQEQKLEAEAEKLAAVHAREPPGWTSARSFRGSRSASPGSVVSPYKS
jgi:hypothetical protein